MNRTNTSKKRSATSTDATNKRRAQIAEEIGEDTMKKLCKALTVLVGAMLKRAEYRAKVHLQNRSRSQSPEESA